jgi:hypothetical protein
MATTETQTIDIAQGLADALDVVIRSYWFVSDAVRPPALVIGQPSIDYQDAGSGFCSATWIFPMTLVVSRSSDREAQVALSRILQLVSSTLAAAEIEGVFSVEPLDARPVPVTVSGQEMPGYLLNVRVRA